MPKCSCSVEGAHFEWAQDALLIRRLHETGRVFISPKPDGDLKPCNKHCAHNAAALKPLLAKMALEADWSLFTLAAVQRELLSSTGRNLE